MSFLYNMWFLLFFIVAGVFLLLQVLLFRTGLIYILKNWMRSIEDCFHVYQSFKVPEFNENMQENQLYRKISVYMNSLASIEDSDYTNLFSGQKANEILLEIDSNQTVHDTFLGAKVTWSNEPKSERNRSRTFVLKIRKLDKRRILRPYLQHIHSICDEIDQRRKELKLYMNTESDEHGRWRSIAFTHPSTLDTIAMDSDLKNKVRSDLETFLKSKQYYHRLGRVWKRSYLLYGPSGTGKSSFIAAMANFLCYDVYDIDLSKVSDDTDLKMLLLQTTNRSIIVLEELDRLFTDKSTAVSLSGILNFMDGLLTSCCGEERVMVYTMSSKELADSAILRPGRIDLHINFPLCDFKSFKALANNYLGLKDHKLFPQVEEIFQTGASMSPAEIGELMLVNRSSPSRAIKSVISALQINGDAGVTGKIRRRVSDNELRKSADESAESNGVICREKVHTVREFRKLYGLLKMKSCGKAGPLDVVTSDQNDR